MLGIVAPQIWKKKDSILDLQHYCPNWVVQPLPRTNIYIYLYTYISVCIYKCIYIHILWKFNWQYLYIYIYATPPPGDLLFRRCMRRKEQMRYTFCFVKKVRRWHWSRRTWYDLDAACNLALSRCHSLCSILSQQSRGKAPLVLMGRADRLYGYMRRTKLNDEFCIGKSSIVKWLAKHVVLHTCNIS